MADINGMIDSMGLTLFCNDMFKGMYYFLKNGSICRKLETNCKKAIAEFESLKWPLAEKTYPDEKVRLFRSSQNFSTFEDVCNHYQRLVGEVIDETISDLKQFISENSLDKKLNIADKLKSFFDVFADYGLYASRDCLRC